MELNFFIFPVPRCNYQECQLSDLIRVPVYTTLAFPKQRPRAQFSKIEAFEPPEDIPNEASFADDEGFLQIDLRPYKSGRLEIMNSCQPIRMSISPPSSLISSHRGSLRPNSPPSIEYSRQIPCLYLKAQKKTKKTILFFHANSEDLGSVQVLVDHLRKSLCVNVLVPEYPGYGTYTGRGACEENILTDAEYLYKYLVYHSKIGEQNMIIMGRSIGTGPATHLAARFKPSLLCLISPFKSLQQLIGEKYPILKKLVKERFPNDKNIHQSTCPIFIVHGQRDTQIPCHHSIELRELCRDRCMLRMPSEMTHSKFHFDLDFTTPLQIYMKSLRLTL